MFPCPAGLRLLRSYQYDLVYNQVTPGANTNVQLRPSARRVGLTVSVGSGSVIIFSGYATGVLGLLAQWSSNTTQKPTYWHSDLGPAIFGPLVIQYASAAQIAYLWEINLPTDYHE